MSSDNQTEIIPENENEQEASAPDAPEASPPQAEVSPAVAQFRKGFYTDAQFGLLLALGEEPREYQRMMESLLEDLGPRPGLEQELVEQMGETFWQMRRAQRMRNGLALNSIKAKMPGEEATVTIRAAQAFAAVEPFERLQEAFSPRHQGPTPEQIEEFVESRKGNCSEEMQEFIALLRSLAGPLDERQRRAARRQARERLIDLMEPYASLAWKCSRKSEHVRSAVNMAAMMAPEDRTSAHLQRMEDAYLRRMWRLTNTLAKVRQGILHQKDVKKRGSKPECV